MDKPLTEYAWPNEDDNVVDVARHTTPEQRLAWLEELLEIAASVGALDKQRELDRR